MIWTCWFPSLQPRLRGSQSACFICQLRCQLQHFEVISLLSDLGHRQRIIYEFRSRWVRRHSFHRKGYFRVEEHPASCRTPPTDTVRYPKGLHFLAHHLSIMVLYPSFFSITAGPRNVLESYTSSSLIPIRRCVHFHREAS